MLAALELDFMNLAQCFDDTINNVSILALEAELLRSIVVLNLNIGHEFKYTVVFFEVHVYLVAGLERYKTRPAKSLEEFNIEVMVMCQSDQSMYCSARELPVCDGDTLRRTGLEVFVHCGRDMRADFGMSSSEGLTLLSLRMQGNSPSRKRVS